MITATRRRLFVCALVVALAPSNALAASSASVHYDLGEPIFHLVAGAEEIPENVAGFITQDKAGFLWIGTPDGLVRYDGYSFRAFRHDPHDHNSLAENHVRTIHAARDGRVWIGTGDDGVSIFDPATESFRTLTKAEDGLSGNRIRAFADGDGGIWVASTEGLDFVDERSLRVSHVDAAPPDQPNRERRRLGSLLVDARGDLWIGSADGLAVRRKSGVVESAAVHAGSGDSLSGKPLNRIFEARDGALWLAIFGGGVARFDPGTGVARILDSTLRGYEFEQPENETIWAGTTGDGIHVYDASTGELVRSFRHDASIPESLPSNRINSMFVDRSGVTWIGTTGRGLARYNPADGAFRILRASPANPSGLTSGEVECIFESSDGLLWVGTHDNGVDVFDATTRVAGYRAGKGDGRSLDSPNIGAIAETSDGSIWLGGFGTLNRLDRRSGRIEGFGQLPFGKTSGRITVILPTADERGLWIATNQGLAYLDITSRAWSHARFDDDSKVSTTITDIDWDAAGTLWVTTQTGIAVLPKGAARFHRITNQSNSDGTLPPGSSLDILLDADNRLWIGMSNGLLRLVSFDGRTARFESVADRLGFENRRCDNLLQDAQRRIWIEDNAVFDPVTFKKRTFASDEGAGRSIWRGAAIRTRSGQFVLGGPDGLFFIDPSALREWDYAPPLAVTAMRIDGQLRPPSQLRGLTIEPGTRSVSFEFAALDFSAPQRNRYAYRLLGYDLDWSDVDSAHRTATFTSLPPGDYTLEIRGSNREGVWSREIVSVPMRVAPTYYQTRIFRLAVVLLLVGLTWPIYRIRLRMLKARQGELEAIVARRTAELTESEQRALEASQAKTIFLANMSHELRTPLNTTLGFARLMRRSRHLGDDDRENLSIVERSGEHLLSLINQVLSISKIEAGKMTLDLAVFDLQAMLETIGRMFQTRAEEQRLGFSTVVGDAVPRVVRGDEGKLRQAILNLLGNAVKFTSEGSVALRVSAVGERVRFEVADTGRGIAEDERHLLFQPFTQTESGRHAREGTGLGLAITKRIVELMGGTIEVDSRPGEGTTFRFEIPLERCDAAPETKETPRIAHLARGTKPPRILVADDTLENRALLQRLLGIVGCEVRCVENGALAVDAWRSWRPDLIFMDVRMPVMDGREATRAIRREETPERRTAIVALTASVYAEGRDSLLSEGVDEVIFKPYTEDEIFGVIGSSLGVKFSYEDEAYAEPGLEAEKPSVAIASRGESLLSSPSAYDPSIRAERTIAARILLTDDDFVNRALTREMLRLASCEVVEATNGEEALERLEADGPFDAILLDVEMPRMGGIETVRRIRTDSRFRTLPVIAMTAHSDHDDVTRLKAAGMNDHIAKPLDAGDLRAKLSQWIRERV